MSWREIMRERAQQLWLRWYFPSGTLPAHIVDCPECGLRVQLPKLRQGQQASCPRCGHRLVRIENVAFQLPLACAVAALLLVGLVYTQTFVEIVVGGIYTRLTLIEMVDSLMLRNFNFLGSVLLVLTFGTPVLFLLSAIYIYISLIFDSYFPYQLYAARLLTRLNQWIMVDVFFVSAMVADIKMSAVAQVKWGMAFWLMPPLVLLLLRTAVAVPIHWVYYQIYRTQNYNLFQVADNQHVCCTRCLYFRPNTQRECDICGSVLFDRRPRSVFISFCFLLAAILLYVPANLLPIMISSDPTSKMVNTIMNGIIYMWQDGDRLISVIIFCFSIVVPTLKIISMLILLFSAKVYPVISVEKLSLQYRLTEAVGAWSMVDIFVIIILMTAFHTPIANVMPGPAAFYFCMVVILTMLSAYFFDIRLIWDWKMTKSKSDNQLSGCLKTHSD